MTKTLSKVKNNIIDQLVDYHIGLPEKFNKPINYVMTGSGLKTVRENKIGFFVTKAETIPGLEKLEDSFKMKLPKIPAAIIYEIIAFFKWVHTAHDTEAMIHVYFDEDKQQYFCDCPTQKVGGASVKFDKNVELESKYTLVMDIHSHNNMGAFFSGTDDGDEKETILFGVIGEIKKAIPDMKFRAGSGDAKVEDLNIDEIFDIDYKFPEEWKTKVEKTTTPTTYACRGATISSEWNERYRNSWSSYLEDDTPYWYQEPTHIKGKKKNKKKDQTEFDFAAENFNAGEFIMSMVSTAEILTSEDINSLMEELQLLKKQKEMIEFDKVVNNHRL